MMTSLDPAQLNLLNATRGTLGVVLAFKLGSMISPLLGFIAGLVCMLSNIVIGDATAKDQKKTYLFLFPVGMFSMCTSILLGLSHEAQLGFFLVFTFIAIYLRKFGPRGVAVGMMAFMTYFSPLFFPLKPEMILQVCEAIVVGLGISYVLRFHVLKENPEKVIERYLEAFNRIYSDVAKQVQDGKKPSFERINEITLLIDGYAKSESLQLKLFEKEMNLRFNRTVDPELITKDHITKDVILVEAAPSKAQGPGLASTTKMAIQATISTALSSFIGLMISQNRWYWAPLTSFVIMVGSSRGEILLRAAYRVTGTILGLSVGFSIVYLIKGHHTLEWSCLIVCVFLGLFSVRFAYGFWTASFFSVMLVNLFDVLGQFNMEILFVRFEETFAGASLGAMVAALILPTSTRKAVKIALANVLRAQVRVIDQLPLVDTWENKKSLVRSIRSMDRELENLKVVSAPYLGKLLFMQKKMILTSIHDVTALDHFVRNLATNKNVQLADASLKMREISTRMQAAAEVFEKNDDADKLVATLAQEIRSIS